MSILLFGSTGMLGSDLLETLQETHQPIIGLSSRHCDIQNPDAVTHTINSFPSTKIVINCAAYTKVDDAETQEKTAFAINADGPKNLAMACNKTNKHLIHFSTDYVFDGTKDSPYTEEDPCNPINVYGKSKLAGEVAIQEHCPNHTILRVQWLYGKNGPNFIKTMQQLFQTKPKLTVIADQWGSPTSTQSLAHYVQELLKTPLPTGLFHCHDDGYTNWHEYTTFLAQELNYKNPIIPTESTHYPSPAKRPLNGKLSQNKLATHSTFTPIPWKESVQRYLKPQP